MVLSLHSFLNYGKHLHPLKLSIIDLSDKLSLYNSSFLYENVPLPRRLGVLGLVSSKESFNTPDKHCEESNSSGERSAIASQSVVSQN